MRFDELENDAAAASWLANVSGYIRARIALAEEFTGLDPTSRDVVPTWLDMMVDDADTLISLREWSFVADVAAGAAGMRVVGTGEQLVPALRRWLRRSGAPLDEETAPGELAVATGGDVGSSVLVDADRLDVQWFVTGELATDTVTTGRWQRPSSTALASWAERVNARLVELGTSPSAGDGVDQARFRLMGSDRKERLLDALELYDRLEIPHPRRDVLTAFMNYDLGAIDVQVRHGEVGVVEIGLVGEHPEHAAYVLLLDDFGPAVLERAARLQGVMDAVPSQVMAALGQRGDGLTAIYPLATYHADDADDSGSVP